MRKVIEPKPMRTKIAWATHKFNPWVGCEKVSPACDNCYACSWAKRAGSPELWSGERRRTTDANWLQPLKLNLWAERTGIRPRVFCASLADVFDNKADPAWRAALWSLIRVTPHLDWLMLTKRIGNAHAMLPADWGYGYFNVWIGATVANQAEADRDIPKLLKVPARVRWLSCEPLLGPIQMPPYLHLLDWVIVGGESGAGARPMPLPWADDLLRQCREAGVAGFMKQLGARPLAFNGARIKLKDRAGADMTEWPEALRVRKYPAFAA